MKHKRILKVWTLSKTIFLLLFLLTGSFAFSQSKTTITGTVRSGNEALIGANVFEKGTKNRTITDLSGNFTLTVSSGSVLEISYLGYQSKTLKVGNQTKMNIELEESPNLLN